MQPIHRVQLRRAEHQGHVSNLVQADAVFSGNRSPGGDAQMHDLRTSLLHTFDLIRITSVKQQVRMEISISRVEEVREP